MYIITRVHTLLVEVALVVLLASSMNTTNTVLLVVSILASTS